MTVKEKLKEILTSFGMFDSQAESVVEKAIPQIEMITPDYQITWDRPAEEYPDAFYNVIWLHLKPIALQWIDENLPEAWFRQMFT